MKCMYCGSELETGTIQLYQMLSLIPSCSPATIKYIPYDKSKKVKKSNSYDTKMHGYYCVKCNRIIADFSPGRFD